MVIFDPILESIGPSGNGYERDIWMVQAARRLYEQACSRGRLKRLWRLMTRRSTRLLDLSAIEAAYQLQTRHYLGVQMVSIDQIAGSEGRSRDFDNLFYPCQKHSQERWLGIAAARMMDLALPPVELIQVGASYFVRDGHHRLSVARALGEQYIEAEVTVWQINNPLPGKRPVSSKLPQPSTISTCQTPG
jgi:hypothetical protein